MGAPSKRARKLRRGSEFDVLRLVNELRMPRDGQSALYSWDVRQIVEARDAQAVGTFVLPSRMEESMRCDDAIFPAYQNRLAPQRCIPVEIVPARSGVARAARIAHEAEALFGAGGVGIHPDTMADIHGCLVNHGVAFGVNVASPRADGSRVDFELKYFPIEYVWWDQVVRCFKARCDPDTVSPGDIPTLDGQPDYRYGFVGGFNVPVIHGDGRWVIFQKNSINPFRHGCILPASIVWARHAFAARDWAKASVSHGSAKVVGELPEGMALQGDGPGGLSPEAAAFMELLGAIESADSPYGVAPSGSKVELLTNNSTAWQVWKELVANAEKAAARIYLGTDGTLGTTGGAPGVDITALFGVASTIVRGDLDCITRGLQTGVIEPWTAINFGDSSLSPSRRYVVPDEDQERVRDAAAKRVASFWDALKDAHDSGIVVDQDYADRLASSLGAPRVVLTAPPVVAPPKPAGTPDGGKITAPNAAPPAPPGS